MDLPQQLVEHVFEAALALDLPDRAAYLDQACCKNPKLKAAVEDLLLEDVKAGSLLEHPPVNSMLRAAREATPSALSTQSLGPSPRYPASGRLNCGDILIGRFLIQRFIAKGGMGEVYEAEDRLLQGARIALKTILPHIADDPALRERFEHEVLLARQVNHPNLCPVYEIFQSEQPDLLFLTMKLLPGETLSARLRRGGAIAPSEGLSIVKQMAAGLSAIHDAGIIHRDIKPNNIMLDGIGPELRLSITDFGLARVFQADPSLMGKAFLAGTPSYMAPELFLGSQPSQSSDLFAFGVVLHEIFTGQKPAQSRDNTSVRVHTQLRTLGLPTFCTQLIAGCLDQDPMRRCQAFDHARSFLNIHYSAKPLWTRRRFAFAAASLVGATASTAWWKRNELEDLWRPLPSKRFVALLNWPRTTDINVTPMLTGVLSALKKELTHFETMDRDLFVITPEDANVDVAAVTHLKELCGPLGANLVLAASGIPGADHFQLFLRLIDPASGQPLRQKRILVPAAEITTLPAQAVRAAASLLNLARYLKNRVLQDSGTQSPDAFIAFQAAEGLVKQPDWVGLDAAIEKYKHAISLDSRYALAYARLGQAYAKYYFIHKNPGALDLARGNAQLALNLAPGLEGAHLALAATLELTGNIEGALRSIAAALALEPSDGQALIWQARLYNRLNRWQDANKAFRRTIAEHPNNWLAYNEFGYGLDMQGRYREAVEVFRIASLAAPGNALALSNLGFEYLQIGAFDQGAQILKSCMSAHPASWESAVNTSLALRYQGKLKEAVSVARKATELSPSQDTGWLELGDCYLSLGNAIEAKKAYLRAREEAENNLLTDSTDGLAWVLLAFYKVKSGSPHDASSLIDRAEKLGAQDMNSQLFKGRVWELLGKRQAALDTLAACFRKGASDVQVAAFPDMHSLRNDPRYRQMAGTESLAATASGF
jgi:eukaryotic-like serine/threonine-protein kinase